MPPINLARRQFIFYQSEICFILYDDPFSTLSMGAQDKQKRLSSKAIDRYNNAQERDKLTIAINDCFRAEQTWKIKLFVVVDVF